MGRRRRRRLVRRTYRADPDLLAHLPANVRQPVLPVEAVALAAPVPQHAQHLPVLCWFDWSWGGRVVKARFGSTAPSKQVARTHAPWPSSLKIRSRFVSSFSFFPRRRFLPPLPGVFSISRAGCLEIRDHAIRPMSIETTRGHFERTLILRHGLCHCSCRSLLRSVGLCFCSRPYVYVCAWSGQSKLATLAGACWDSSRRSIDRSTKLPTIQAIERGMRPMRHTINK